MKPRIKIPASPPGIVVAIGGSAGAIEAVKTLLEHLPPHTGMTFLYVQHLDPSHESALDQVLAKSSPIRVSQVTRALRIESDHLYICPSDKDLVLQNTRLKLLPRKMDNQKHLPIDRLFVSVATSCGPNAIGILLSGNSADGTAGLSAIRAAGGKTFAQDATAAFGTMPRSAVAKGVVDHVLAPEQIAVELGRLAGENNAVQQLSGDEGIPAADDEGALDEIYRILLKATGIDFSLYKKATIERRIGRRIRQLKLPTPERYAEFLRLHAPEAETISEDLLIHVTSFFRFPQAITYLKQSILPRILKAKGPGQIIRIWVPACSTGEEVYSIAMALMEVLAGKSPGESMQIFASDLSEKVLAKARSGVYTQRELKGVSRERLGKFFTRTDTGYRIIKPIRDCCIFSKHNVFSDPPITRIDLLSCSNLLIYLENALQKKVLANCYFALNPDGYLMLGRSETAGPAQNLFTDHNKKYRIYTKVPNAAARAIMEMNYRLPGLQQQAVPASDKLQHPETLKAKTLDNVVDELLLKSFVPACVVVNKDLEILQFRGNTGPYLEHPAGKATLNLFKMARAGLGFELKKGVLAAAKLGEPYQKDSIEIATGNKKIKVGIRVVRLLDPVATGLYMVLFRENTSVATAPHGSSPKNTRIGELEAELLSTREDMRAIVEEQQSVNEELQAANEEVLSSNEELQTINEELETSKEEIESANEELLTVNNELYHKNMELTEAQEHSETIISTLQEAVLVLNADFSVRLANKTFYTMFNVDPADIRGRTFFQIGHNQWDLPELYNLLGSALYGKGESRRLELEVTVRETGKKTLVFNVRKLSQEKPDQQLIFIAIEDVTQRVAAEKIVAEREAWFHNIADQTPALIWVADKDKRRTFFNRAWLEFTGRSIEDELGLGWANDIHPQDRMDYQETYDKAFRNQQPFHFQYRLRRHDGEYRWIMATGKPLYAADGGFSGFLGACNEIHDQRMVKEELERTVQTRTRELSEALAREKELNEMKSRFVTIASHEFRTPLTAILSSIALLDKYTPEQYAASKGKHLGRIKASINILKEILDDFLSVEKLEENKVVVIRERIDVGEEVRDIAETAGGILKPGQRIVCNHTGPPEAWADKKLLRNILINLLSNASKFSEPEREIRLESKHVDGKLLLHVRDKGIGISKKDQQKLFDRFFRAANAGNVQGTGLGLHIAKRYAALAGGTITLKSRLHQGSTFTVELPATAGDDADHSGD